MKLRQGDTLVEVALAIGIFSMVAITIVSVVSASTSGAQTALETTITREDLDAQAEALRFIHESYISGTQSKDTTENAYAALWQAITGLAREENVVGATGLNYMPGQCSDVFNTNGTIKTGGKSGVASGQTPFVINTRQLGDPSNVNKILIRNGGASGQNIFYQASTFPRIIYGTSASGSAVTDESFYAQTTDAKSTIQRVEGIYVTVVKDSGSKIVAGSSGSVVSKSAYYDFYIRSCWLPPGADKASTISTVIRLYDPAAIVY